MKNSKNKSKISAITFVLMLTISAVLFAVPTISAQDEYIRISGSSTVIINQDVLIRFEVRDSSGRIGYAWQDIMLGVKSPGSADFIWVGPYSTSSSGRDDFSYTLNELGTWEVMWTCPAQGPLTTDLSSEVLEISVVKEISLRTFIYVTANPHTVGVHQKTLILAWLNYPFPGALVTNDIRFHDVTITITKPDGSIELLEFPVVTDTTSSMFSVYYPDQVGTYKMVADYAGQVYTWSGSYKDNTFLPSVSEEFFLTVQEDPLTPAVGSTPGPEEYWTRPIEGQNTDWWNVASSWMGTYSPQLEGVWPNSNRYGRLVPDGVGPETPHVMWTKPIQDGGVVGGIEATRFPGDVFYNGINYNARFRNPIIMHGRLFYELPWGNSGTGGGFQAVDLRTGEILWNIEDPDFVPDMGQYINWHVPNQHGTIGNGFLWDNNYRGAMDPKTGQYYDYDISGVPSGTKEVGPMGEELRYSIVNYGTSTAPDWYVLQWNSSRMVGNTVGGGSFSTGGTIDAGDEDMYDWNVSITGFGTGMNGPTIDAAFLDDIIIGRNGSMPSTSFQNTLGLSTPFTEWAISLKPESRGQVLWMRDAYIPADGSSMIVGQHDKYTRIYLWWHKEALKAEAFNMDTGAQVWGPKRFTGSNDFWETDKYSQLAYGNLYYAGYEGLLVCVDMATGNVKWTYGNGGPGNSTQSMNTNWGRWPLFFGAILGEKVYLYSTEHSPNSPIYKDGKIRCIDAFTGEEIWTLTGYGGTHASNTQVAGAEGFLVFLNSYDMQIYSIGRGPSATTVSINDNVIEIGDTALVTGTVTDIAAGTTQNEQAARFPNGVPAVSDDSMSEWMSYVYSQKPRPKDATGVEVVISTVDPNGNEYELGRTTSDANGQFKMMITPPVPGEYNIIARFEGSLGYWPSQAATGLGVLEAPSPAVPIEPEAATEAPFITTELAIIAAVIIAAIIGIVAFLALRRRK